LVVKEERVFLEGRWWEGGDGKGVKGDDDDAAAATTT